MLKKIFAVITMCLLLVFSSACGFTGDSGSASNNSQSNESVRETDSKSETTSESVLNYVVTKKGTPQPVYSKYYEYLGGKDVMPVGTFSGPQYFQLNDDTFKLIKESGVGFFTSTIDGTADKTNAKKFLALSDKYEIGVFLTLTSLGGERMASTMTSQKIEKVLSDFVDYESFMGFELKDEPNIEMAKEINKTIKAFKASKYSDYEMYYNAFPNYATPTQLSGTDEGITYENYVRAFIENMEADYFSYDYYPFGKFGAIGQGYFENMSIVRNICQEYEIPFWTFIQCGADFGYGFKECIPDENRFRWNVATSLAYGAKGIQYFTLTQPQMFYDAIKDKDPEAETRLGMFGYKNNINQWYYYAKDANAHIAAVDGVLMNCAHEGVIFHGKSIVEPGKGKEIITSGKYRQLISVEGDNSIVGCFDYNGGTALYIVNNSVSKNGTVILSFDDNYCYEITQKNEQTEKIGKTLTLSLDKGEGALVVLK